MTTPQLRRASPYNANLPVSSVWEASFTSWWPVFLWGSHGGVAPPPHLEGSEPPAVLALGHVCCSANPPVLASHWATSLRLSDLAVCREGFSRRHGNGFILPPITHPFKVFDWPVLPRRRGGDRARDYGMRNGPREKERVSWATSQLIENPAEFFMKIEKLLNFFFVALSSLSTVLTFGLVCAVSLFHSYLQWSQRSGWN